MILGGPMQGGLMEYLLSWDSWDNPGRSQARGAHGSWVPREGSLWVLVSTWGKSQVKKGETMILEYYIPWD